ncbi:MAG: YegP family protein [Gammaproteobacteria bacterium]|jgi:uncharacterized protein YegP (UPF0339 family)
MQLQAGFPAMRGIGFRQIMLATLLQELRRQYDNEKTDEGASMAAGTFELKTAANGAFHFTLKARNGRVIASSRMYKTNESALKGIESVHHHAADGTLNEHTG